MSNQTLIKVNEKDITEMDVIIRLKNNGEYKKCLIGLIELSALKQVAKEQGVSISEKELQIYSDKKRQELGLFSVTDTNKYLNNLGVNIDQWADHLEDEILENKAKEKLFTDEDIDKYYEMNKILYSTVNLNKISVEDNDTAQEIITQLGEGENFEEMAKDNSIDETTAAKGGYVGVIKRGVLSLDIENRLFAAEKNAIIGPFKENGKFSIYKINDISLEKLDDKLRKEILEGLYAYWKQNILASAKIETV